MVGFIPNIGLPELALIFIIILLIFGPGKLPEVGKLIGRGLRNFKQSMDEKEESQESKVTAEESHEDEAKVEKKESSETT